MKKPAFLFLAFVFVLHSVHCFAQPDRNANASSGGGTWFVIDSLLSAKNTDEALSLIDSARKNASLKHDMTGLVKAKLYQLKYMKDTAASEEDILAAAEARIKEDHFPYNAIWQSIVAELYREYYLKHRAQILERPVISREVQVTDIDHWDVNRFYDRTATLFFKSLSRSDELRNYKFRDFASLVSADDSVYQRMPTLFDFLAYRVLNFLEDNGKDLTVQQEDFLLDDPNIFAPEGAFVAQKFTTKNLTSYAWLSLQWYKQLLLAHESDSVQDALIYADLSRLDYVYRKSPLARKKVLYGQALEFIETAYPNCTASGLASVRLAELSVNDTGAVSADHAKAVSRLKNVVAKFPGTTSAIAAENMLDVLQQRTLALNFEKVILPNENAKFLLSYRNVSKVAVKIVAVPANEFRKHLGTDMTAWCKVLHKKNAVAAYQVSLPESVDGREHTTEIKTGGLPIGTYALLVSCKQGNGVDTDVLQGLVFQVSSLYTLVDRVRENEPRNFVLHRKSGIPLGHVNLFSFIAADARKPIEKTKTKKDGTFVLRRSLSDSGLILMAVAERDTLVSEAGTPLMENDSYGEQKASFLIPDMPFEPGSEVPFTVRVVYTSRYGRVVRVASGEKISIYLRGADGRTLATVNGQLNHNGVFSSGFVIPQDAPGGEYTIGNESGQRKIQVYTLRSGDWNIESESMRGFCYPGEQLVCRQQVRTFGGKALEGVRVRYKVVRSVNAPASPAPGEKMEQGFSYPDSLIQFGTTQTDRDGRFSIDFKAVGANNTPFSAGADYVYTVYTIASGEDGSFAGHKTVVHCAPVNLQVSANFPETIVGVGYDSFSLKVTDVEGRAMACNLHLKIERLLPPSAIYKKRSWPRPDMPLYDSLEYRKLFPHDEYGDESDPEFWPASETVLDTSIRVSESGSFALPPECAAQGGVYRVYVTGFDQKGATYSRHFVWAPVNETKYNSLPFPLAATGAKTAYRNGDQVQLKINTGFDSGQVVVAGKHGAGSFSTLLHVNEKGQTFSRSVTSDDADGAAITLFMLRENRIYTRVFRYIVSDSTPKMGLTTVFNRDSVSGNGGILKLNISGNKKANSDIVAMCFDNPGESKNSADLNVPDRYSIVAAWHMAGNTAATVPISSLPMPVVVVKLIPAFAPDLTTQASDFERVSGISNLPTAKSVSQLAARHKRRHPKKHTVAPATTDGKPGNSFVNQSGDQLRVGGQIADVWPTRPISYLSDREAEYRRKLYRYCTQRSGGPDSKPAPTLLAKPVTDSSGGVYYRVDASGRSGDVKYKVGVYTDGGASYEAVGKARLQQTGGINLRGPLLVRQGDTVCFVADVKNTTDSDEIVVPSFNLTSGSVPDSQASLVCNRDSVKIAAGKTRQVSCTFCVTPLQKGTMKLECTTAIGCNKISVTRSFEVENLSDEGRDYRFFTIPPHDTLKQNVPGIWDHSIPNSASKQYDVTLASHPAWLFIGNPEFFNLNKVFSSGELSDMFASLQLLKNWVNQSPELKELVEQQRTEGPVNALTGTSGKVTQKSGTIVMRDQLPVLANRLGQEYLDSLQKNVWYRLSQRQNAAGVFPWFSFDDGGEQATVAVLRSLAATYQKSGMSDSAVDKLVQKSLAEMDKGIVKRYLTADRSGAACQWASSDLEYIYIRPSFTEKAGSRLLSQALDNVRQGFKTGRRDTSVYGQALLSLVCLGTGDTSMSVAAAQQVRSDVQRMLRARPGRELESEISLGHLDVIVKSLSIAPGTNGVAEELKYAALDNILTDKYHRTTKMVRNASLFFEWGQIKSGGLSQNADTRGANTKKAPERRRKPQFSVSSYAFDSASTGTDNVFTDVSFSSENGEVLYGMVSGSNVPQAQSADTTSMVLTRKVWSVAGGKNPAAPPIDGATGVLKTGDKVTVKLHLVVKQATDFVDVHDVLPAGLELRSYFSGSRNSAGVACYESACGSKVDFFLGHLQKGTYTFEYTAFATTPGTYQAPPCSVLNTRTLETITVAPASIVKIAD